MDKKPPKKIDEDWLTTYGDMVSLLLCFFVMLVAVSKPDLAKFEQIRSTMSSSLGKKSIQTPIETMMVELKEDAKGPEGFEGVSLGVDSRGVVIELGGDITFDQGSATLKAEAMPTLKRIAATLRSDRYKNFIFNVEGHTSDEKFSNLQYPSNWELSSARAAAIARFLESRGIERYRLKATGLYDIAPKFPNYDPFGEPIPENKKRNRRVVIHVEPSFERHQ